MQTARSIPVRTGSIFSGYPLYTTDTLTLDRKFSEHRLWLLYALLLNVIDDHIRHELPAESLEYCAECIAVYLQSNLTAIAPFKLSEGATRQLAFVILNEMRVLLRKKDKSFWLNFSVRHDICLGSSISKIKSQPNLSKSMLALSDTSGGIRTKNVHMERVSSLHIWVPNN